MKKGRETRRSHGPIGRLKAIDLNTGIIAQSLGKSITKTERVGFEPTDQLFRSIASF